jgi:hypothetical protein
VNSGAHELATYQTMQQQHQQPEWFSDDVDVVEASLDDDLDDAATQFSDFDMPAVVFFCCEILNGVVKGDRCVVFRCYCLLLLVATSCSTSVTTKSRRWHRKYDNNNYHALLC